MRLVHEMSQEELLIDIERFEVDSSYEDARWHAMLDEDADDEDGDEVSQPVRPPGRPVDAR